MEDNDRRRPEVPISATAKEEKKETHLVGCIKQTKIESNESQQLIYD